MIYDPTHACCGLPTLPFGLHKYLIWQGIVGGIYDGFKVIDQEAKRLTGTGVLDVFTRGIMIDELSRDPVRPVVIAQSPKLAEVLYPYAHENFTFCGNVVIDKGQQMSHAETFGDDELMMVVQEFLAAGKKPIYCGWGSMTCKSPTYMVEFVARALMLSNQRAIVGSGWAELSLDLLRTTTQDAAVLAYAEKNIMFVTKISHEWLFPLVACTVHHGGAGTVSAAMRAGTPTVVTPVFLDQFDSAYLVNELGVGVGMDKQLQKITVEELSDAIRQAVSSEKMAAKAQMLGKMLCAERGAKNIVNEVEKYWTEWVESGKERALVNERLWKAGNRQVGFAACLAGVKNWLGLGGC